ncbi:hypothetical protein [Chondromyces apiculatus]|uniref:Uncharacterized protein n=1 Tax=Chondromyces apiculatus DSM 436 TaxID=1192034 RepID=A0A017TE55_9BACT|nr:hypothetical protein [Chondromyces apiculatus]EYF07090.1 Hypothetical protein CAP_1021 [Chondromyces apiculatus DSM 436]
MKPCPPSRRPPPPRAQHRLEARRLSRALLTLLTVLAPALPLACGEGEAGTTSQAPTGSGAGASTGTGASGGGGSGGGASSGTAGGGGDGAHQGDNDFCTACSTVTTLGQVQRGDLQEASGLAASAIHPDVLYTHEDAGNDAEIFVLGVAGEDLGLITASGADPVDWEDIARGPCAAGSCLYVGDTGDNDAERATYAIYRLAEPEFIGASQTLYAEQHRFRYPDGSHNAETLLVHPTTGMVTVVTKVPSGFSSVYEFTLPPSPGDIVTATKVTDILPPAGSPRFTGGDVHPQAKGVLLRTLTHVFFYPLAPDQRVAEALSGTPCAVAVASEDQGEAIAWTADGSGYITVSEGEDEDLHAVACTSP